MDRDEARRAIVKAAERNRQKLPPHIRVQVRPHTMKRIQWAVFNVRQRGGVSGEVLEAAGFRSKRRSR